MTEKAMPTAQIRYRPNGFLHGVCHLAWGQREMTSLI